MSDYSPEAKTPRLSPRGFAEAVVVALPLAAFFSAGWAHRWIADDGFIYLRVVRQIRTGHGPVFNAGERVEAFTSPLWVAVLSVADVVTPMRLEWLAVGLGLTCSVAGVALAVAGSRVLVRRATPTAFLVPFGLLVFAALLPAWVFQTSGLETGLTFAWEGACLVILAQWARPGMRRIRGGSAIVLGLGWLVRPELALFSVVFLLVVLAGQWRADDAPNRARLIAAMFALPFIYQVFRMGYYGSLVANTAVAKEGTQLRWDRGWSYFADFARPYWLWLAALALVLGGYLPLIGALRQQRATRAVLVVVAFVLAAALDAMYVIAVGGDYIHARLLLPALFAFCAPIAVIPMTRRHIAAVVVVPWVIASAFALRPPQVREPPRPGAFVLPSEWWGKVTAAQYAWGSHGTHRRWYTGPHVYVQDRPGRRAYRRVDVPVAPGVALPIAVLRSVGLASFAMGPRLHVLDVYGLGDAFAAHLTSTPSLTGIPRRPAHEKPLPSVWIAARITPAESSVPPSEFPNTSSPLIRPTLGTDFQEQIAWARAALRCPQIQDLTRSANSAFSVGRFVTNFLDAFQNTRLRIPPDPEKAYRHFCGPEVPPEVRAVGARRAGSVMHHAAYASAQPLGDARGIGRASHGARVKGATSQRCWYALAAGLARAPPAAVDDATG